MERMCEYRMARMVLMTYVSIGLARGKPRLVCMDGAKVALGNRGKMGEAEWASTLVGKSGEPWYICN